ncbi:sulfatase-like hydrolase/transferase [Halorientalis halophila]|uniref:sulfatase-like hydrolase/transferase n=1 Tax=Halorientalis halophila TaxID=3108499 RepID=UPI0030081B6B
MDNVAVVVLDSLRYDDFATAFDWLPGRRFTRAFSTATWAAPVAASLLTGRYPSEVGVHSDAPALDCPTPSLAERLAAAGYTTRAFSASPALRAAAGWDRGFDEFAGYASLASSHPRSFDWGPYFDDPGSAGLGGFLRGAWRCLGADCATQRSLREGYELLTRSAADGGAASVRDRVRATDFGDDEFLLVDLTETASPYHPPAPGEGPVSLVAADAFTEAPPDLDRARRAYRRSVEYLAEAYREIFADLAASFDYVITCSNHGELFGEYGAVSHAFGLYPELTRVPLVVSGPDLDGRVNRVVSLLDVHRTVAEVAGIDVDSRGRSLLEASSSVDRLVEYHGPPPGTDAQFRKRSVPSEELDRRRAPLRGFVAADGSYAYQTHTEGFQTVGEFDGDPRARLAELQSGLDVRQVDGEGSKTRGERLEEIGYA